MENLVISGREVMNVTKTSQPLKEYSKESKMAGQKYWTFSYGGKAFAVNENSELVKLSKEGKAASVTIGVNEDGQYSLISFTSQEQELAFKKFEAQLKRIDVVASAVPTGTLTEEQLQALIG